MSDSPPIQTSGLILSGGGARAAYQAGALAAIADIGAAAGDANPFPIICGTSAGAINAAMLAIHADNFRDATARLRALWENLQIGDVYRCDMLAVVRTAVNWFRSVIGGRYAPHQAVELLDNRPLRKLLREHLDFGRLPGQIAAGRVTALAVNATSYRSGRAVTFFQGSSAAQPWARSRRCGVSAEVDVEHLMASSAIPFLYRATRIGDEFFADGSMRQLAPLSPALHLGAKRILVIAVGQLATPQDPVSNGHDTPTFAQIAGHALTSVFLDHLSADLERLQHLNRLVNLVRAGDLAKRGLNVDHIDVLVLSPQESIAQLAVAHVERLPRSLRLLLRGLGSAHEGSANFMSYLLFDHDFCRALVEMGYRDALARRDEIAAFLRGPSADFLPLFPPELY
jgi:NTE family protein